MGHPARGQGALSDDADAQPGAEACRLDRGSQAHPCQPVPWEAQTTSPALFKGAIM